MNSVQILGTMTRDIELRYTQSGTAIGSFGIAYNEKRKQQDGSYGDVVHFFDVTAFGKAAENIDNFFRKGSRILIHGSLYFQGWNDKYGTKRSKVGITLEKFDFIDRKDDNQSRNTQTNNYAQHGNTSHQSNNGQVNQRPQPTYEYQNAQRQPQQQARQAPPQNNLPEIDIDEDEIPFAPIGLQYPMLLHSV